MQAFPASSWPVGEHVSPTVTLPTPLMSASLSFDRTPFTNPAVSLAFGVVASLDGGNSWPLTVIAGTTVGGVLLDRLGNPRTTHNVGREPNRDAEGNPVPILPAGARVRAWMTVTGGTAALGAGDLTTA